LEIFQNTSGYRSDKVALTLNLIAEVYRKQGKYGYDESEQLYHKALDINLEKFGEEHPEVAECMNGLAQVQVHLFSLLLGLLQMLLLYNVLLGF
jgi:hypothetical protein